VLDDSYETVRRWVLTFRLLDIALGRAIDGIWMRWSCALPGSGCTRAALWLMRKLLKKQGFAPNLLVTDKLRSYGSAFRRLLLTCPHEQGLRRNNRAENSHQPVRRRERKLQRFKSARSAQCFLSMHAVVQNTFNFHATSSPDPHCACSEPKLPLIGEALS
jgi:hypothetical protein